MVLEVIFVVLDYFSEGVFGNVSIRESDLVKYGTAIVLLDIPTSYVASERAVAGEIALNRKIDECLGSETA